MLKTLAGEIKEFKKVSILTPLCMIMEVVFETIIPLLMASIIDDGVNAGNMKHIYIVGALMVVAAFCGLFRRFCEKFKTFDVSEYPDVFFLEY